MIWFFAAAPFWVSGFFFLYIAFYCVAHPRSDETNGDLLAQFVISFTLSVGLLYVAARMSS